MAPRPIGALIIGDEILSGKRADQHLAHVIATPRRARARARVGALRRRRSRAAHRGAARIVRRGDIVFAFGGVGATPDDHTRQAAAAALRRARWCGIREALAEIEARFGADA